MTLFLDNILTYLIKQSRASHHNLLQPVFECVFIFAVTPPDLWVPLGAGRGHCQLSYAQKRGQNIAFEREQVSQILSLYRLIDYPGKDKVIITHIQLHININMFTVIRTCICKSCHDVDGRLTLNHWRSYLGTLHTLRAPVLLALLNVKGRYWQQACWLVI